PSLVGTPARADEPPPPPDQPSGPEETSRRHFEQGVALYNEHNYEGALAEFQASYHDRAVASVLFNIALTYKAMFKYAEATEAMERFLREGGDSIRTDQR